MCFTTAYVGSKQFQNCLFHIAIHRIVVVVLLLLPSSKHKRTTAIPILEQPLQRGAHILAKTAENSNALSVFGHITLVLHIVQFVDWDTAHNCFEITQLVANNIIVDDWIRCFQYVPPWWEHEFDIMFLFETFIRGDTIMPTYLPGILSDSD